MRKAQKKMGPLKFQDTHIQSGIHTLSKNMGTPSAKEKSKNQLRAQSYGVIPTQAVQMHAKVMAMSDRIWIIQTARLF